MYHIHGLGIQSAGEDKSNCIIHSISHVAVCRFISSFMYYSRTERVSMCCCSLAETRLMVPIRLIVNCCWGLAAAA